MTQVVSEAVRMISGGRVLSDVLRGDNLYLRCGRLDFAAWTVPRVHG